MKKLFYLTVACCASLTPTMVVAESLQGILNHALISDPSLDEARANIAAAESQTKISEAGHLPIISLSNDQVLAQKHRYTSERRSGPSLVGRVNLYSWGAVESEIARDKEKYAYHQYKLSETREQMGKKIGELYLTALRAKESIAVYQESIKYHEKTRKDLEIIASYDEGRTSELNEVLSRKNQAETALAQQERLLDITLSQLSRYSKRLLSPKDLSDPFAGISVNSFLDSYRNSDITNNPTYLAQQKEFNSAKYAAKAAKERRLPAINLEGSASRHEREVFVNLSWDLYNPAARHEVERSYHSQAAADAKLREIELDVLEKAQTAELEMLRNQQLATITNKQIALQRKVVEDYGLQFEIGIRSLIDLLNSYQELATTQIAEINARNDFRDAALLYLVSQANVAKWAGLQTLKTNK